MSARTHRRRAREVAMQALFQLDQNPAMDLDAVRAFIRTELKYPELEVLCESMVRGVRENLAAIDELLAQCAENWSLSRMAPVDRNVLRLGVYEICFAAEATPAKVVMNEAIEICKRYSTERSARFVNGILDRVARQQVGELASEGELSESENEEVEESSSESVNGEAEQ